MPSKKPTPRRNMAKTTTRVMLGGLVATAACSGATPGSPPSEGVGTSEQPLLSTACTYTTSGTGATLVGTLTLTVQSGEVAYVAKTGGCVSGAPTAGGPGDTCVWANANFANGNPCVANSVVDNIVVKGPGVFTTAEKAVFDFTNGLFNQATTTTPLLTVNLDGPATGVVNGLSKVAVIAPTAGGNMALAKTAAGVNQLSLSTLASRANLYAAMTIAATKATMALPGFEFFGGAGPNVFTGDIAGWTTPPGAGATLWATIANLTKNNFGQAVAAGATSLPITATGGAGNDILAGGANASNTLNGGGGNDTFLQSVTPHAEAMHGGDGVDTVDTASAPRARRASRTRSSSRPSRTPASAGSSCTPAPEGRATARATS